ncbi:hypothetical protein PFISCL1PPCAC_7917, partial [Pristionchus fissidentatus]
QVKIHKEIPFHPNIAAFECAWIEDRSLYMQMELCDNSLDGYWKTVGSLSEEDLRAVLVDSLMAIDHLNQSGIVHLDIKEANILRNKDGRYKLTDFSVTCYLNKVKPHDEFGDGKYAAPEVLQHTVTYKADIFSLGITLAQVCYISS